MTDYTNIFGGGLINRTELSYVAKQISADVQLVWPLEQSGADVMADIMDINATGAGFHIALPDALKGSLGHSVLFNNVGADSITIDSFNGPQVLSLTGGTAWVIYLTDNSTESGTWVAFQMGASVSVSDAAALAGAGLKSIGVTLNQTMPMVSKNADYTLVNGDRGKALLWTGAAGTFTLPDPTAVGSDWFAAIRNGGSGSLSVAAAAGLIDGAASISMSVGDSAFIVTNGTDFFTVGLGQATTSVFDFIEISVPGTGTYTLSGAELNRISYRFSGILTGNRTIVVPATIQQYWVHNNTTGAFSLFFKTAAQAAPGVEIAQGDTAILYSDSNDVINAAKTAALALPIAVAQGGTGAITATGARIALDVPSNAQAVLVAAANVITQTGSGANAAITLSSAQPTIALKETDAGADRKNWDITLNSEKFQIRTRTDADVAGTNVLNVERAGTTPTVATLTATDINLNASGLLLKGAVPISTENRFPAIILKTANEIVNNSTAFQDDNDFAAIPLVTGAYYRFEAWFYFEVLDPGGTSGFKFKFVFTDSPTFSFAETFIPYAGLNSGVVTLSSATAFNFVLGIGNYGVNVRGGFRADTVSGGTFKMQWAQSSAIALDLTLNRGSWIRLERASVS